MSRSRTAMHFENAYHFTANDDNLSKFYSGSTSVLKESFETLIRTTSALPNRPALILFEGFGRGQRQPLSEITHYDVALSYAIPVISARRAFWQVQKFQPDFAAPFNLHVSFTWHRRFACLIYKNLKSELNAIKAMDFSSWLDPSQIQPIYGGTTERCKQTFSASALEHTMKHADLLLKGWQYGEDAPGKFGLISNVPGATINFNLNGNLNVFVLTFMTSYTSEWGTASIQMCQNEAEIISAKTPLNESQYSLHRIDIVPTSARCNVTITNIGGKFKIVALDFLSCS